MVATVTGTEVRVDASGSNSGSVNIAVPSGATMVAALWSHWDTTALTMSSLTLDSAAFTIHQNQVNDTGAPYKTGTGVATLPNPTTGASVSFAWDWSGTTAAPDEGGYIYLVFTSGGDTSASRLSDSAFDHDTASVNVSITLTSTTTDLIIAHSQDYSGTNPNLPATLLWDNDASNTEVVDVCYFNATSTSETVTNSNASYSSIVGISLKESSGSGITNRSLSDNININDSDQNNKFLTRYANEYLSDILDSINPILQHIFYKSLSDQISIYSEGRQKESNIFRNDFVSVIDDSILYKNRKKNLNEKIIISDLLSKSIEQGSFTLITRNLVDSISLADALSISVQAGGLTIINRALTDSIEASENLNRYLKSLRSIHESIEFNDSINANNLYVIQLFDSVLDLAETISSDKLKFQNITSRALHDEILISESYKKLQHLLRNFNDVINTSDDISVLYEALIQAQIYIIASINDDNITVKIK